MNSMTTLKCGVIVHSEVPTVPNTTDRCEQDSKITFDRNQEPTEDQTFDEWKMGSDMTNHLDKQLLNNIGVRQV